MTTQSSIELKDLILKTDIGTYGPGDVVPDHHVLDLTLAIAPTLVLIEGDSMAQVFDYDDLVADIRHLAGQGHRDTQEWLVTQIAQLCARYTAIDAAEIYLRKVPVGDGTGTLGVRLAVDRADLARLAKAP
ncbi:hypothetical protein So717_36670 [Roseobacter cerasinus]|uniref:Dihydroneopterin aldolase/epimerase domain-containing protein n=1 Tax=Roseobacter cerasinus TaxID=2602289 RepID=A0A640VWD2_9RHOB|nr:dihydroneopterin aldolase [Roseobacter cerasinus]GFE51914.1 hypothetical protein So717_36670 [Roseobacter cerasinus]